MCYEPETSDSNIEVVVLEPSGSKVLLTNTVAKIEYNDQIGAFKVSYAIYQKNLKHYLTWFTTRPSYFTVLNRAIEEIANHLVKANKFNPYTQLAILTKVTMGSTDYVLFVSIVNKS